MGKKQLNPEEQVTRWEHIRAIENLVGKTVEEIFGTGALDVNNFTTPIVELARYFLILIRNWSASGSNFPGSYRSSSGPPAGSARWRG